MLNVFKRKKIETPKEKFWNWFIDNKSKIEKFIQNPDVGGEIYEELTVKIKEFNDLLFPELMIDKNDNYILIITPDGMSKGVKPTQELERNHPEIENWIVKKFRQATDNVSLGINGVEFPIDDIEILHELDEEKEKVDIRVFIRNMSQDEKGYQHLAFLYFDHILGEFNTITRVGYIEFFDLESDKMIKDSISLLELRKFIEKELY
ncbi:MAG: hypothetical protein L3J14_02530 [Flavobacteriaceae bacterium]|nr:hypothetical protein [Flavobacteriaceae bacterium]